MNPSLFVLKSEGLVEFPETLDQIQIYVLWKHVCSLLDLSFLQWFNICHKILILIISEMSNCRFDWNKGSRLSFLKLLPIFYFFL